MSSYAHGTSGGSAYARATPLAKPPKVTPPKKSGGGFLGSIEKAAHWTAQKTELAGRDIKAIPGGLVKVGSDATHDFGHNAKVAFTGHGNYHFNLLHDVEGMGTSSLQTLKHPLRDPFATALTVIPALSAGGRVVAGGKAASEAGSIGGAAKALVKPPIKPRLIKIGEDKVPLQPSSTHFIRGIQAAHDKLVQRALNNNPEGRIAAYGQKRVGNSLAETARYQARMRDVPANNLVRTGKNLSKTTKGVPRNVQEAALRLTSENSTPAEAHAFHLDQARKGVNPKQNFVEARKILQVEKHGLLKQDENGHVVVDAEKFPNLAKADSQLAREQTKADNVLLQHGIRSPEALATRVNAPARVRLGATYDEKAGGFVGGEAAPPGRGYVPYKQYEPRASKNAMARSRGPVVGKAENPISGQSFTGEGLQRGEVPDNTTRLVAQHVKALNRFVNTDEFRQTVAKTGSPVRRSSRDVLIRLDKNAKVPDNVRVILGQKKSTLGELDESQNPGYAYETSHGIGAKAPKGFKWVDKNALAPVGRIAAEEPGRLGRTFNNINSAVTAATVYFKIGHVGTRVLTDASTNLIQGSLNPVSIGKSVSLFRGLAPEERMRALAAAGQHGFDAMPHEGVSKVGQVATKGAQFWAKNADARFRFNSLAYEARKVGYKTPDQFRGFLNKLENQKNLSPEERAKVDGVAKRANRQAIAYDRLSPFEQTHLARAFWFYPWLKGSTVFAKDTVLEHPYKAGALTAVGAQGRKQQGKDLGQVPSYESGLFKLGNKVADFSTFSPFATPADLMGLVARPGTISGQLNPAYGALTNLVTGVNQYGQKSKSPIKDAATQLASPTPEAQVLRAFLARHQDQSKRMFPTTPMQALLRTLIGPGMPRPVNRAALNKAYGREVTGR